MASVSSSYLSCQNLQKLDLDSMRNLVLSVNQYMEQLLEDPMARKSLQRRCATKLKMQRQEFFEFSEQSVLSNLYWGLESFEAAIQAKSREEKRTRLKDSEQKLQVPALLGEHGSTGGVSNRFLVSCAYFYLSLVKKLQKDGWQTTLHFLQSMLVSPRLIRKEFAPELWEELFLPQIPAISREIGRRCSRKAESLAEFCEDAIDGATRRQARRYKDWLVYYRVVFYGETPRVLRGFMDPSTSNGGSQNFLYKKDMSTEDLDLEQEDAKPCFHHAEMNHLDPQRNTSEENAMGPKQNIFPVLDDEVNCADTKESLSMKCLQDILQESQSDTSISAYSHTSSSRDGSELEAKKHDNEKLVQTTNAKADFLVSKNVDRKILSDHCIPQVKCSETFSPQTTRHLLQEEDYEVDTSYYFSSRSHSSASDLNFSSMEQERMVHDSRCFDHQASTSPNNFDFIQLGHRGSSTRKKLDFSISQKSFSRKFLPVNIDNHMEIQGMFEKAISTLCSSDQLEECENAVLEISIIWGSLKTKTEAKCTLLHEIVLDRLLDVISISTKEEAVVASILLLSILILKNSSVIDDIKRKDPGLFCFATALKKNTHEAAILIYLLNPSPSDIEALELFPILVEVACNSNDYKLGPISIPLTPSEASIKMIEEIVAAVDYPTKTVMSPQILSRLVKVADSKNLGARVSLAAILLKCMRSDGSSRSFLSRVTPMAPIVELLQCNEGCARCVSLELLHEILQIPWSSAIGLLRQIRQVGRINVMHILMACIQQVQPEHQLLAANLLFQLDILENPGTKSIFREEALEVLLEPVSSEESSSTQILSSSIISNLTGNYTWTGDSYTVAWLLKKAGLASCHRNMIRNHGHFDESIQEVDADGWCSKIAKSVITIGNSIFHALNKGLQSKIPRVSRDCLIAATWIGSAIMEMDTSDSKYSACEILLPRILCFLHPGLELEERLLACLFLYNYAYGKGMQKLMEFSEGQRDSIRRLSSITWMAEELLKAIDYSLPSKLKVSCVHTQILEAGHSGSGAASALIYYKGQLCSGYSDGSIKVWDIKGKTTKLVWEVKAHKKQVACFGLLEPGNSLLSGSADKTIRIWQMLDGKLECIEAIQMGEPVRKIDTHGPLIFVITESQGLKVFDESRTITVICTTKHVQSLVGARGKVYLGCKDSSIQEVDLMNNEIREIEGPEKSWGSQKRPINSIIVHRNWVYSAGATVKGSNMQTWRMQKSGPITLTALKRGSIVQAMAVVEDFIYLSCSSTPSILQIWLRGKQQKVGRLSAGSRIMSLLAANDIIFCGTETGLIRGWIPL